MAIIYKQLVVLFFSSVSISTALILQNGMVDSVLGHHETQEWDREVHLNRSMEDSMDDWNYGQSENYFEEDMDEEIDEELLREFADLDVDDFDIFFKGRWSYAPGFIEKLCRKKCQEKGKPFGRLLGAKCSCYCPLNAGELDLCSTTGHCDKFCASQKFFKGGDCVFNNVCFCYCKPEDEYNVWVVYTLDGSSTPIPITTTTEASTNTTSQAPTTATPAAVSTQMDHPEEEDDDDGEGTDIKFFGNAGRPGRPNKGKPKPGPKHRPRPLQLFRERLLSQLES